MKIWGKKRVMCNCKKGWCLVILLLLQITVSGGCGTVSGAVARLEAPERSVVAYVTTTIPAQDLISIQNNSSPAQDQAQGLAGAVEPEATVNIYDVYPGGTLLYSGQAAANGAFAINIGDDDPMTAAIFITATKAGKSESEAIVKTN